MKAKEISIAIPYHGDRIKWTQQTILNCHGFNYVKEIVIVVDPSSVKDVDRLYKAATHYPKVRIILNEDRLFVFRNKVKAVESCRSEWVALIDSDNIIGATFLGPILNRSPLSENVLYCPEIGFPALHYEEFSHYDVSLKEAVDLIGKPSYDMLINTMNYVLHRDSWLSALKSAIESNYDPISADSAWINYNCMKAGMLLRVIRGCCYKHTVHDGSTYRLFQNEGVNKYANICKMMKGEYKDVKDFTSAREVQAKKSRGISSTSDISAIGGSGRGLVPEKCSQDNNRPDLLSD